MLLSFCFFLVTPALAEDEDSDNFTTSDFFKPQEAKKELDNSAFKKPVEKGVNWGTLALIGVCIVYFGKCALKIYSGDDDDRAKGFIGLFVGVLGIVVFLGVTSTALDIISWGW
jgi:hypothetical protein